MLKNHLRLAWRNLLKDRQFTALNLIGLSTGLACSLLIYLWVSDEYRVDRFNANDQRLYQVMTNFKGSNGIETSVSTPGPLGAALQKEIPEVEKGVTVLPASWFNSKSIITFGDEHRHAGGEYVDDNYFELFTRPFLLGDAHSIFSNNNSVAISEDLARSLFKTPEAAMGKTVQWDNGELSGNYTITGVFRKLPSNATAQFDALFNFSQILAKRDYRNWTNFDPNTYILVRPGTDIAALDNKLHNFLQTKSKGDHAGLTLIRYSDRYLHNKFENGVSVGGRITYVRLFSIIALVILVIAAINFMNLSTAKASRRIKEVGIKKVVGALRPTLILQYLSESLLMAFIALGCAALLIVMLLPVFNELTGKQLTLDLGPSLIGSVLGITILTGLLAGSYPALYLSGFRPAAVLKGQWQASWGALWIRKGLVVFQFALSVVFIVTVLVVYRQINYIQSKDLGYNREQLVHFEIPMAGPDSATIAINAAFVARLRTIPGVVSVGSYYHSLMGEHGSISDFHWKGKDPSKSIDFANLEVGYNFIETAGIHIKEGRSFSQDNRSQNEIVFNETAIKAMGLKDPVGQHIQFWGFDRVIVGVAEDFHFESLYSTVKPCFFQVYPVTPNVLVRITEGPEQKATIERLATAFHQFNKSLPFDYKFLDQDYQTLYSSEERIGLLSRYFAGLAILISCLGLFGLAAFTAQKRQKEIGIRKVVGASVQSVVLLLSKDFLRLVLLAIVLAMPLAWFLADHWLQAFAYRATVPWWLFPLIAVGVMGIAFATVSYQSVRAALTNPTRSLRSE